MTPEQNEAIIKGLLFAASDKSNRLQQIDAIDTAVAFLSALATSPTATVIAPEQGLAEIFEDLWCGYSDTFDPKLRDLLVKGRALLNLAASQPAPAADTGQAVAWQYRYRPAGTLEWSEWGDGKAPAMRGGSYETQERPLYPHPATLDADTGQAVASLAEKYCEGFCKESGRPGVFDDCTGCEIARLDHPAPLDAERVREAWAYRVHDCHIARSPVKARAKFPEATEHLYPASRHADAIEMARLLGGTCTPLYPPEDAR